jgi:hypothetical protein
MGVLMIGMSAILGMLSFGAALSRTAALRGGASRAIDALVTDLEETLFPLVLDENGDEVAGEPVDLVQRELQGYPGLVYSTHSTPNPENPLEYKVEVEVQWAVGGTTRSKRFTTLLLREVPFGERLRARVIEGRQPLQPPSRSEARRP